MKEQLMKVPQRFVEPAGYAAALNSADGLLLMAEQMTPHNISTLHPQTLFDRFVGAAGMAQTYIR